MKGRVWPKWVVKILKFGKMYTGTLDEYLRDK